MQFRHEHGGAGGWPAAPLNLKQILECFLRHRREVVTRRTVYELKKSANVAILEGLAVALSNVDEVIALIKASARRRKKLALMAREWHSPLVEEMLAQGASDWHARNGCRRSSA